MLAYTYMERGKFALRNKPVPVVQDPHDAVVRVTLASICTSDLHIKHGSVPRAVPGVTVGHEMVGVVEQVGAAVTATYGSRKVEALSTTGTVVMELPTEGTWSVTAVRGAAQYNTATVVVTNQYKAALTASLHVQYFGPVTALSVSRLDIAATTTGNYALFGGGSTDRISGPVRATVDAYSKDLVRSTPSALSQARSNIAAASVEEYALFAGGERFEQVSGRPESYATDIVDAYSSNLTRSTPIELSQARQNPAAATVGGYALFAGGLRLLISSPTSDVVDAYDESLTRTTPTALTLSVGYSAAAAVSSYAVFASGSTNRVHAYNTSLTRSLPTPLSWTPSSSKGHIAGATAGNYMIFVGESKINAYDSFLTKTQSAEAPPYDQYTGTSLKGFAIFQDWTNSAAVVYDPYLVRTLPPTTASMGDNTAGAAVGEYALFGAKVSVYAYKYI